MSINFNTHFIKEKKWSRKIIVGLLRQKMPVVLYDMLLTCRYMLFKRKCSEAQAYLAYSDGSWVTRKPTKDLLVMQDCLLSCSENKKIFQTGIGNSSLYGSLKKKRCTLVGITIVEDEVRYAHSLYDPSSCCKYSFFLDNKYSKTLNRYGTDFDFIVDNDISSYACCKKHFFDMLESYYSMLVPGGCILIGARGLGYFDSGFGMNERMAKRFFSRFGFEFFFKDGIYFAERRG